MTRVGVTATRRGLTAPQAIAIAAWLTRLRHESRAWALHHGDCLGGDVEVADIARTLGYRIVAHPPTASRLRAFYDSDVSRAPLPYLERDRAIVAECDLLIGCPDVAVERDRSGTWYTIRHARAVGRALLVLGPAGQVMEARADTCRGGAA